MTQTMTQSKQIYRCEICGNIVEVEHIGAGTLVCCGEDMLLEDENKDMANAQKHIPVIVEDQDGVGVKITIGEILHPMTEEHHLDWVQVHTTFGDIRKKLELGEAPIFVLPNLQKEDILGIRSYCNEHGLYVS